MKKLILFTLISILPIYAYSDKFWVSGDKYVQKDIETLEKNGWIIKEIKSVYLNEYNTDYIIKYGEK